MGRGKISYLIGDIKKPDMKDLAYVIWDAENSMVMTWLVNSMNEEIRTNYLCYSTAKELWDNVSQMHYVLGNQSQVYELTLKLVESRQGEDSVTKYFNSIKRIWQDLDLFNDYEWKSSKDYNHYHKSMNTTRAFKFRIGLNVEFDEVYGRIIGRNPLPPIGEVFVEVWREESHKKVMLGKRVVGSTGNMEGLALAILKALVSCKASQNQRAEDKNNLRCDYYGKPCHTQENCYKLDGRPPNAKGNKTNEHYALVVNEAESSPFSKKQLDHLVKLLTSYSSPDVPISSMVQHR